MKKVLLPFLLAILSLSTAFASTVVIDCGDTNESYVATDLNDSFAGKYLTDSQLAQYESEGYDYMIAGRNCGLGNWQSEKQFSVVFLFEGKKVKDNISFGPLTIKPATLSLQGDANKILSSDLTLVGGKEINESRNLTTLDGSVTGTLIAKRGTGNVKVIIMKGAK